MKLIHAHIENFGKLQDYDLHFTDGLNKVVYDNGWGKSTLVAFIRVMLYGFENERKRSEVENERKRFEPWQGGTYGGSLVFEQDGKQYRIERVFEKNNDSFELYDNETNLPMDDYSENIGEELFGIDRESFSRTVFVGQQDCSTEATSQINSKIGNVSAETADMAMFDKAATALHNEQNRISARRATGELAKLRNKIAEKESFIGNKSNLEASYENATRNIAQCQEQIKEQEGIIRACDKQLEEAAEKNRLLADKKDYSTKIEEKNQAENKLKALQAKFPKSAPSLDEIDSIITAAGNANGLTQFAEGTELSREEKKEYVSLQLRFGKGVPSDEELHIIEAAVDQIEELREEKQIGVLSDEDLQEYYDLEKQFSLGVPEEDRINQLIDDWNTENNLNNRLYGLNSQYDGLANRLRVAATSKKAEAERKAKEQYDTEKKTALVIMAAGIAVFLLGLFAYLKFNVAWWLLLLLAGLAVIAYGYFLKMPKESMISDIDYEGKDYENDPNLRELADTIQTAKNQLEEIKETRTSFLTKYGLNHNRADDLGWFYELLEDVRAYNYLEERLHTQVDFQKTLHYLTEPVTDFFEKYKMDDKTGNYSGDLFRLKNMLARYQNYKETVKKQKATRNQLENEQLIVKDFLKKYDLKSEEVDLTSIRDDVIALESARTAFENRKAAVEAFEAEHDMQAIRLLEDYEEADLDSVKEAKQEANDALGRLFTALKESADNEGKLAASLQEIEEAEEELKALQEQERALAWRQTIVNKTADYLVEAKNNFLKKYLAPMQNAFDQYFELLSGENTDVYELDAQLNISKRANGKLRNVDLLSEGYKDLVGLCRRMAMVDAMYEEEKPFLVFDDPFVNLDDEKLECGLDFMKDISRKYQVIYTTCHTSRTV